MGLVALCKALDDDHDRALDRIARLEDYFGEFLPGVYSALNDFLVSRKVSAAQPTIVTAPDVVDHAAASGAAGGMLAIDAGGGAAEKSARPAVAWPAGGSSGSMERRRCGIAGDPGDVRSPAGQAR